MGMGGSVEGVSPWKKTLFVDGYVSLKCIEVCLGMAFIKNGVGGIFYGKRREGRREWGSGRDWGGGKGDKDKSLGY